MNAASRFVFVLLVLEEADDATHVHIVNLSASLDKRPKKAEIRIIKCRVGARAWHKPIEEIAVVCDDNRRFDFEQMIEEFLYCCSLVYLVEDGEFSREFGSRRVLKVVNVCAHNLPIDNKEAAAIDHVADHHYLIERDIWEFERHLGRFYVVGANDGIERLDDARVSRNRRPAQHRIERHDIVPKAGEELVVYAHAHLKHCSF